MSSNNIDSENFRVAVPNAYKKAGDAYREALFYQELAVRSGEIDYEADQDGHIATTEEMIGTLRGFAEYDFIDQTDVALLLEFMDDLGSMSFDSEMSLREARGMIDRWLTANEVTVERNPLTYHTLWTIKEALLTSDITPLLPEGKFPISQKGADDETLCSVTPKYSFPPYKWYCTKTDKTASSAAQKAIALAVKELFSLTTAWSSAAIGAVGIAVSLVIDKYWDDVFCKINCDACGPAAGVRTVFSGCTYVGIEAVGSFEYADRITYLIDANRDGGYETTIARPAASMRVGLSDLPPPPFYVVVDVACDGSKSESMFP